MTRGTAFCAMFLLIPMMFLSTVDVSLRKAFSVTIPGTMELSSYMLALFILLGLSYTHQRRAHVRVTLLLDLFPSKVKISIETLLHILSLGMLVVLIKEGWVIALEETTVSDMLRIPETPFRMALVVGCFTFALEIVVDIAENLLKLRGK
jgi:TRAP-type C4-dicarboxylate transport system permease small subunit